MGWPLPFFNALGSYKVLYMVVKSESHLQIKAFPYVSVLIVLFPIFVALKILDHVETAVVTPSLGLKTNDPTQKPIWTWTRASFLRRQ